MTQLPAPEGPPRARLGSTALVLALFPALWVAIVAVLIVVSLGADDTLALLANAMFFTSFAVVPLFSLLAIILGILALLVNTRRGKILGGLAILVVALEIVGIVVLVGGSFDLPAQALGAVPFGG